MHQLHPCPQCLKRNIAFDGICWECQATKARQEALGWSAEQLEEKIDFVVQNITELEKFEEVYKTFFELLSLHGVASAKIAKAAFEHHQFSVEQVYYQASPEIRDALIAKLAEIKDPLKGDQLLLCLSMQGDDVSLQALLDLELNPAPWQQRLYAPPSVYTQTAGWTFDRSGARTSLVYEDCYAIEQVKQPQDNNAAVPFLTVAKPLKEVCAYCEHPLVALLDVDAEDPRLSQLQSKGRITALCCMNCFSSGDMEEGAIFTQYQTNGQAKVLSSENHTKIGQSYKSQSDYEFMASQSYVFSNSTVSPFYPSASDGLPAIGGYPSWAQDATYLSCPQCEQKMHHLAQIPESTILPRGSMMFYISICTSCQITGVIAQGS